MICLFSLLRVYGYGFRVWKVTTSTSGIGKCHDEIMEVLIRSEKG